jgi:NAD(P)-dependent dehydrogenase (short-subunit alcohol dehydrogenase family)
MTDADLRTILVTGSTAGLGRYLVGQLAGPGTHVVVHGRAAAKVDRVVADLARQAEGAGRSPGLVTGLVADLADLSEVDLLADHVIDRLPRLDVLVNNAGLGFGRRGAGREASAQGLELRFAVNYLAGVLLTRRLLPLLRASAPARVVNVASIGQQALDLDDLQLERGYDGATAYRRSKLAQIMFTLDVAAELDPAAVTVNALHPATFMDTPMVIEAGGQPMSTVEEGGAATLRLIEDPALAGVTGRFYDGMRAAQPHPQAADTAVRAGLRRATDELLAARPPSPTPDDPQSQEDHPA